MTRSEQEIRTLRSYSGPFGLMPHALSESDNRRRSATNLPAASVLRLAKLTSVRLINAW